MKTAQIATFIMFLGLFGAISSCRQEDPGPRMNAEKSFSVLDFDRVEVSDAFDITIQSGAVYSINANGDSRNLGDMLVDKSGSTLRIRYNNSRDRQYTTYITITMPIVRGIDFSGSVNGRVTGFADSISRFDASVSGASVAQVNVQAEEIYASIAGASNLRLTGTGKKINASVSGASELIAFDYPVDWLESIVSGASRISVTVNQKLIVEASGASEVVYRGDPEVQAEESGTSVVRKD